MLTCYSLLVTCLEWADLLALLYVRFFCVFVPITYGVLDQVWCLIVWIPDLCLLYFYLMHTYAKFDKMEKAISNAYKFPRTVRVSEKQQLILASDSSN